MADENPPRAYFGLLISVLMVVTGSMNTIAAKYADSIKVDGKLFDHPFLQATCMFVGEFSCLVVFFIIYYFKRHQYNRRHRVGESGGSHEIDSVEFTDDIAEPPHLPQFNPFVFLPPACCDVVGTSLMYIGLNLTQASSFQMLRGAVIIFTGLLSVAFLNSKLKGYKWLGMGFVTLGLVVVGLTDILFSDNKSTDINAVITGDLLIIMAQIIVAIQMVYEQKYLEKYDVPALFAVGLEGLFGMTILSILMIPMYFIYVPDTFSTNPFHRLEDVIYAFQEMAKQPKIVLALMGTVVSIAFFNFAGVSVTKYLSATTRMVLDSVRTLIIWAVSIPLFGEHFHSLQLLGFGLLILGMFVYNDLILGPFVRSKVLPRMGDNSCTPFCLSFWGIDLDSDIEHQRLAEDVDDLDDA
uniref:TPT domain-containing protein n=1 Tax=Steinernema glaseri TaxID=37863 RepID=A0A1I8A5W8_9BILA